MTIRRLILILGMTLLGFIPAIAIIQASAATVPEPPPGTIYGTVTQKPCVAQDVRDDCSRPVPGASVVLYDRRGEVVAHTWTHWNGDYSVSAPPGIYVMKVAEEAVFPDCPATRVIVSSLYVFEYDVECRSGPGPTPQDIP